MLGRGVVGVLQPPQSGAMASQVGLPDHGGGGENGEKEQERQWRQDERGQRRALEETEVGGCGDGHGLGLGLGLGLAYIISLGPDL